MSGALIRRVSERHGAGFRGALRVPVHSITCALVSAENPLFEALANFVAHLFAEFLPARRSFSFRNIESIKYVKIFQDRITVAGHGQDAKEFVRRSAGTGDLPSAYGVGTAARGQATKLRHIRTRQRPADGVAEILAKLFQFRAGHCGYSLFPLRTTCEMSVANRFRRAHEFRLFQAFCIRSAFLRVTRHGSIVAC